MKNGADHDSYWGAWGVSHPVFATFSGLLIIIPIVTAALLFGFNFRPLPKTFVVVWFCLCIATIGAFGTLIKRTAQLEFPPRVQETTHFYSVEIPVEKW